MLAVVCFLIFIFWKRIFPKNVSEGSIALFDESLRGSLNDMPRLRDLRYVGIAHEMVLECGLISPLVEEESTGRLFRVTNPLKLNEMLGNVGGQVYYRELETEKVVPAPFFFQDDMLPWPDLYLEGSELLYFTTRCLDLTGTTINGMQERFGRKLLPLEININNEKQQVWACFIPKMIGEIILDYISDLLLQRYIVSITNPHEFSYEMASIAAYSAVDIDTIKRAYVAYGHSILQLGRTDEELQRIFKRMMVMKDNLPNWKFSDFLGECKSFGR